MSLGLVSYGESDSDEESTINEKKSKCTAAASSTVPFPIPSIPKSSFLGKKPPGQLFPTSASSSASSKASSYSKLGLEKDPSGRVKISAPRYEEEQWEEEDEGRSKLKKAKTGSSAGGGLFSLLPQPQGPVKKSEINSGKNAQFDEIFGRKKESSTGGLICQTIKVPSLNTVRFEAEQKKAEMINKFLKKDVTEARVEEPEEEEEGYFGGKLASYHPQQNADGYEELDWEVDESAYEDNSGAGDYSSFPSPSVPGIVTNTYQHHHHIPPSTTPIGQAGIQPGAVWTANYKYEDVQVVFENAAAAPHGYQTDQQVHKLIAKYEGADFQEYLNQGNPIEIVDFRADDHLGDVRVNIMKSITDQGANLPARPLQLKGKVNKVSKQKGHITYLAAQAQARESELQNQWAKNRQTRQQTSMKYGF